MPQSLANVVVHLVFSTKDRLTKDRLPLIGPAHRANAHAYLAALVRSAGCGCPRVGGTADHVHIAIRLSRTIAIAELVEKVKTASSKWLKTQGPELAAFAWQRGYGVFSLSPADLPALLSYIDDQQRHHRARTFQEEYLANHSREPRSGFRRTLRVGLTDRSGFQPSAIWGYPHPGALPQAGIASGLRP